MMSKDNHTPSAHARDYDNIQAAVMETERGRWFLNEFAQRNRVADTAMLLDAIKKLECMVVEKEPAASACPDVEKMRFDIVDMANAIALTKQQIAEIKPASGDHSRLDTATAELGAIVIATETATSDILSAAEQIQEVAWSMREDGAKDADFDKLDNFATDIYTACSFQDITGQRTAKVVEVLHFLENHIMTMMDIWDLEKTAPASKTDEKPPCPDTHLLNGPALDGEGVDQDDIDLLMADEDELFAAVSQPASQMQPQPAADEDDPPQDSCSNIDLSPTDKLALFT